MSKSTRQVCSQESNWGGAVKKQNKSPSKCLFLFYFVFWNASSHEITIHPGEETASGLQ